MTSFNPNRLSFEQGIERIHNAVGDRFGDPKAIITSRDENVEDLENILKTDNVPAGFHKWQLPVYMDGASQFFMSFAGPGTVVDTHSHDEGAGLRVILNGSITFGRRQLVAGDWMFIPRGVPYGFQVGPMGVGMFYCYQCCCA